MSRDRFRFLERHGFVKLSSFGRTMVDELRGMLVARGGGNSRMLATAGTMNCVEDLDGVDIRSFAPAIGIALDQRTAFCPFGVAAGRDALRPEVARRVRGEMDHETVRINMACAAARVHLAAGIGGLELDAHDYSVMR